jgi:hypothetical protein
MLPGVAGNSADSLRRRDGRGGRRERVNMSRNVQHQMIRMNRELANFH